MTITKAEETYVIEWFEGSNHIFDACDLSESDKTALEKLKERYDALDYNKRSEMRGMLHLVQDGLTCGYMSESAEILARIWDLFEVKEN